MPGPRRVNGRAMGITLRFEPGISALPDELLAWWNKAADSLCLTPWWMESLVEAGLEVGDGASIGVLRGGDNLPLAVLPCRFGPAKAKHKRSRRIRALTSIYSCLFRPVMVVGPAASDVAYQLGRSLGQERSTNEVFHFEAFDGDWPELAEFELGLLQAGFRTARYEHFGNWAEPIADRSFDEYLASRGGALRETVRRKLRRTERRAAEFALVRDISDLAVSWPIYDAVYRRSWKPPEPYPDFHATLARNAARHDALRLGILYVADVPAAVQFWTVWRGTATVLKLAHDETFADLSPGTLLTAHMIRTLIEQDRIETIDFGRGDDLYKRHWASVRRQRIGLIAANPRSIQGAILLAQQGVGAWLRSAKGHYNVDRITRVAVCSKALSPGACWQTTGSN
jgi:Acetyltransferase (GNAT) domain